ncbi:MAG: hypothetical protein AABZ32_01355 [Bacteroidota bacterium]
MTSVGRVEVPNIHILNISNGEFNLSALLQNQLCFLGQELVFADASETLQRILGIQINAKQIERVCHYYGELLEQQLLRDILMGGPAPSKTDGKRYYAMPDGGMVLTREEKWKEMKMVRIFAEDQRASVSKDRGYIGQSMYVAHLGKHRDFLRKTEYHLDSKSEIIIVADGAPWIWKWAEAKYPDSIQILDFYHAKEHLCQWAEIAFAKEEEKIKWIDFQSLLLLNDKVEAVIKNISKRPAFSSLSKEKKKSLLNYYYTHKERMKYRTFKAQGLMIGSGPIEAAHKNVIQQRMKLAGQRWTINGAQQIANLRTANKSNQWHKIINLASMAA